MKKNESNDCKWKLCCSFYSFYSEDESLFGQWFQDTLSSTSPVTSPSPQPPARQKTEGGEAGDSGTETTPSGRSFQMALEEVSDGPTNWV